MQMKLTFFQSSLSVVLLTFVLSACGQRREAAYYSTKEANPSPQAESKTQTNTKAPEAPSEYANWTEDDWNKQVDIEQIAEVPAENEKSTEKNVTPLPLKESEEDYSAITPQVYLPPVVIPVAKPSPPPPPVEVQSPPPPPAQPTVTPAPTVSPTPVTRPQEPPAPAPAPEPEVKPAPIVEPKPPVPPTVPPVIKTEDNKKPTVRGQAIAYVDSGALKNASNLLEVRKSLGENAAFEIPFPERQRFYATQDMSDTIQFLADYLRSLVPYGRLLISDISQKNGGPIYKFGIAGKGKNNQAHESHQNGLDADISYIHKKDFNTFVPDAGRRASELIDIESQFKLFRQAVQSGTVELFIVYPNVKKALCIYAYKAGLLTKESQDPLTVETLARTLPDPTRDAEGNPRPGHISHFHLRLKCDQSLHPQCLSKGFAPKSHGCVLKAN